MPRTCTVCTHAGRAAIDTALLDGAPYRHIASRFGMSTTALQRHREAHIPADMAKAKEAAGVAHAIDVVQQLKAINQASIAVLAQARRDGDGDLALKAVDRVQRQIELQARLLGDLDERPTINVLVLPEWLQVRAALLDALRPHPEARAAVAARLTLLEGGRARTG